MYADGNSTFEKDKEIEALTEKVDKMEGFCKKLKQMVKNKERKKD